MMLDHGVTFTGGVPTVFTSLQALQTLSLLTYTESPYTVVRILSMLSGPDWITLWRAFIAERVAT